MGNELYGKYVALEGIDGGGKSTIMKKISEYLSQIDKPHVLTKEPGGTPIGYSIRNILKSSHVEMEPMTDVLLFMADRQQHMSQVVNPYLKVGTSIISDRSLYSNICYSAARGLNIFDLLAMHSYLVDFRYPDITIILDIPAEEGLKRSKKASSDDDSRFENTGFEFMEKVRQYYLNLPTLPLPSSKSIRSTVFHVVDANDSVDVVTNKVIKIISEIFLPQL